MTLRIAVVGAGYWGPNLVRNFRGSPHWDLVAVCDLDEARARAVIGARSTVEVETSLASLLVRDDIDAIAIATPAGTHRAIALAAMGAGKHVLVEKPLAGSEIEALEMVETAREHDLVLMCDHTYCYTPAVQRIAELVYHCCGAEKERDQADCGCQRSCGRPPRILEQVLNCRRALWAHQILNLPDNLTFRSLLSEDHACNAHHHDQHRRERQHRVEGQRSPQARHLIAAPRDRRGFQQVDNLGARYRATYRHILRSIVRKRMAKAFRNLPQRFQ